MAAEISQGSHLYNRETSADLYKLVDIWQVSVTWKSRTFQSKWQMIDDTVESCHVRIHFSHVADLEGRESCPGWLD